MTSPHSADRLALVSSSALFCSGFLHLTQVLLDGGEPNLRRPRYRTPSRKFGELNYRPAWHDLGRAALERAFERALALREVEAVLEREGLSTTARAVLARIRRLADGRLHL